MSFARWVGLCFVWIVGFITIVASELKEEGPPPPPPVLVDVRFDLTSADLERRLDTRIDNIGALTFTGTYEANQGDKLSLDRDPIALDADDSAFTISISPVAGSAELLTGQSSIVVREAFDIGLTGDPGSFTSDFEREPATGTTTTTVTLSADGVSVLIAGGTTTDYDWPAFEAAEHDSDATLDLRMASAAYNVFDTVLVIARLTEDIVDLVEENKTVLEGMNTDQPLSLDCDNPTDDTSVFELTWTLDPGGSGNGEIGAGDELEAAYTSCRNDDAGYYLDGTITLDYNDPADSVGTGTLGVVAVLDNLHLSDDATDGSPSLGRASPRWRGELTVTLAEQQP